MDPATLQIISGILQHGGSAAVFVVVWVAYKAGKSATDAVEALGRIDRTLADLTPGVKAGLAKLDSIAEAVEDIDRRTQSQDLKLAALRARSP